MNYRTLKPGREEGKSGEGKAKQEGRERKRNEGRRKRYGRNKRRRSAITGTRERERRIDLLLGMQEDTNYSIRHSTRLDPNQWHCN
jgi:hypothetical protein